MGSLRCRRAVCFAVLLVAGGCARSSHDALPAIVDAAPPDATPPETALERASAPPRALAVPDASAPADAEADASSAPLAPLPLSPEVTAKLATRRRPMCRCIASSVDPMAPGQGPYGVIDFDLVVPADGGAPAVTMKRATVEYAPGAQWCLRAIIGATRFGPQPADLAGPYQMRFDGHECEPHPKR